MRELNNYNHKTHVLAYKAKFGAKSVNNPKDGKEIQLLLQTNIASTERATLELAEYGIWGKENKTIRTAINEIVQCKRIWLNLDINTSALIVTKPKILKKHTF